MVPMRVISANVNGIRAAVRRGGLSWLAAAEPDVALPAGGAGQRRPAGRGRSRTAPSPAGTSRTPRAVPRAGRASPSCPAARTWRVRCELEDEAAVAAGRWVEAELDLATGPVTVVSVYVHTGEAETPRQEEK